MNSIDFPLPVSSNFRLFGYQIQSGQLAMCKVVWPGLFLKKNTKLAAEHVFILQKNNSEYVHAFWRYDKLNPSILLAKNYDVFKKEMAQKRSNRYLINLNGKLILLPYAPASLHDHWFNLSSNFRDDGKTLWLYKQHVQYCKANLKRRKRNMKFKGWIKDRSKNILNSYKRYFVNFNPEGKKLNLNLCQNVDNLKPEELQKVNDACFLILTVFPHFFS